MVSNYCCWGRPNNQCENDRENHLLWKNKNNEFTYNNNNNNNNTKLIIIVTTTTITIITYGTIRIQKTAIIITKQETQQQQVQEQPGSRKPMTNCPFDLRNYNNNNN